jgi:hypothetical protein
MVSGANTSGNWYSRLFASKVGQCFGSHAIIYRNPDPSSGLDNVESVGQEKTGVKRLL